MGVGARFSVASVTRRSAGRMGGHARPVPVGEVTLRLSGGVGQIQMTVRSEPLDWFESRLGQDVAIRFDDVQPEPDPGSTS